MNWIEWYRIVAYRDGHDVPHYILATDDAGDAFWILDAGSDGAGDAHSAVFTIHDAGGDRDLAMAHFEQHVDGADALPMFGCIPVTHVQFDETRRAALKLTSPPIT